MLLFLSTQCRDKKKSCFLSSVCVGVMSTVWMFYVLIPERKSENHHPRSRNFIRGEGPSKGSDGQSDPMIF